MIELGESRATPSPSSGGGGGDARVALRRALMPDLGGGARTPGAQRRRLPSPSRAAGWATRAQAPEAPGHSEPESASASASAAAAAAVTAAYLAKRSAHDLARVLAVLATILRYGRVADHGRATPRRRAFTPLVGELSAVRKLVNELIKQADYAAAAELTEGDKDALWSLGEQMMAVIERALEERKQTHADWCRCLLLPPKSEWALDGSSSSKVAARRLVEPSPDGTQAWRIELTGPMVTLPSVMARFATCHAAAWAKVGVDKSAMVFHKLQTECAYNSCLCLSPSHADVWPLGEGEIQNVQRRIEDEAGRKKAKVEGRDAGLADEVEKKQGEFPPTKKTKRKR